MAAAGAVESGPLTLQRAVLRAAPVSFSADGHGLTETDSQHRNRCHPSHRLEPASSAGSSSGSGSGLGSGFGSYMDSDNDSCSGSCFVPGPAALVGESVGVNSGPDQ